MRYLIVDSAVEDVMTGKRSDTWVLISGESIGHKVNRCAYNKLKKPSTSVSRLVKRWCAEDAKNLGRTAFSTLA
jgi:hypothetical protein